MKAYGYSRNAKLICRYGCCQKNDAFKNSSHRIANDRARRKAARQAAKQEILEVV